METQFGTEQETPASEVSESPEPTLTGEEGMPDPGPSESAGETPATGINPAWVGLRDAIGEDHFEQFARPILSEMDSSAHKKISDLNAQLKGYEGYKPFVEQGIEADYLQQALEMAQVLENDPEQLYNFLAQHLGKDGAAPEGEADESEGFEEEADVPPEIQAQLDQIKQFQEEQQKAEEEKAFNEEVARLTSELERETREYIANNPTWTEEDIPELDAIRYQLTQELQSQGIQRIATLDEAAEVLSKKYEGYRKRFGGGDSPATLPTSAGGNVQQVKNFDPAKASKKDFMAQVAEDLASLNS